MPLDWSHKPPNRAKVQSFNFCSSASFFSPKPLFSVWLSLVSRQLYDQWSFTIRFLAYQGKANEFGVRKGQREPIWLAQRLSTRNMITKELTLLGWREAQITLTRLSDIRGSLACASREIAQCGPTGGLIPQQEPLVNEAPVGTA